MQSHRKIIERLLLYINSKKIEIDPNSPLKDMASYTADEYIDFNATASATTGKEKRHG